MRRCADVVFGVVMLLLASPILAVAALAILSESGLPILFRQERVGLQFKRFSILKFRTMKIQGGGPLVTVRGDNRITRVGKVLRLTKIDEFPQFWNVLRGDMSVVGPRPEIPEYVESFRGRYQHILTIRPGITDLASVHFRNEERVLAQSEDPLREYREHILPMKLDLADKYIKERNFFRDVVIVIRTAVVTLCTFAQPDCD